MKKLITSISSLPLLLSMTVAHADTKQYNIEIVIFEDSSDRYLNSEQWPIIHHPEQVSTIEALPETDIFPNIVQEADIIQAEYQKNNGVINITHNVSNTLAEHVNKLKHSSRYNILLHQSWQQTGLGDIDAINIQVDTTEKNKIINNDVTRFKPIHQISMTENINIKSSLQGTLKLILGRYLHIHTDLLYKRPKKSYTQTTPVLHNNIFNEFEIKSQRRMRSNELHYIDHPLLGILIIVTPIKPAE